MTDKGKKEIPVFASEEEEAVFWATQDTADWWEHTEEVPSEDLQIDPEFRARVLERAREKQLLSIRLERRQIALAKRIARDKSIGYQTLMRSWIEEGIRKELARKE